MNYSLFHIPNFSLKIFIEKLFFQIRVFNYNTLERLAAFEAHSDYVRCIAVHPAQPFILTSSGKKHTLENKIGLWCNFQFHEKNHKLFTQMTWPSNYGIGTKLGLVSKPLKAILIMLCKLLSTQKTIIRLPLHHWIGNLLQ